MSLSTATLANRYTMLPNQRTVTVKPRNTGSGNPTNITSVTGVVRRPWSKEEVRTITAGIEAEKAAFIIPRITFLSAASAVSSTATAPKPGWVITDDESNDWTIQSVDHELEGTMFRCPCILNITANSRQ